MTCWISEKSSPLLATPDATMTSFLPVLNDLMAYSRSSWAVERASSQHETRQEGPARTSWGRTLAAVDGDGLDALEKEVLLDVCAGGRPSEVRPKARSPSLPSKAQNNKQKKRRRTVDLVLVVGKDDGRRGRLLEALEEVDHLCLLLDVLDLLDDVERRGAGAADVDDDGLH